MIVRGTADRADLFADVAARFGQRSEYFRLNMLSRLGLRRLGEADDARLMLVDRLLDEHDKRRGVVPEQPWSRLRPAHTAETRARMSASARTRA